VIDVAVRVGPLVLELHVGRVGPADPAGEPPAGELSVGSGMPAAADIIRTEVMGFAPHIPEAAR
jgi:hypothetical protein